MSCRGTDSRTPTQRGSAMTDCTTSSSTHRRRGRVRVLGVTIGLLAVLPGISAASAATGFGSSPGGLVSRDATFTFTVQDLTVFSSDDAWVVGYDTLAHPHHIVTVAEHWNGSTWTRIDTPNPGSQESEFTSISGSGPDDVWAVGYWWNGHGADRMLTEHWDGTAWSVVPSQNPGVTGHHHSQRVLDDVLALSPDDAWAVGYTDFQGGVAEHWNGSSWKLVTLPTTTALFSLSGSAPDDVWATGQKTGRAGVVLHFDGSTWSQSTTLQVPHSALEPTFVSESQPSDAWVAGSTLGLQGPDGSYLAHWDGTLWTRDRSYKPRLQGAGFGSVVAITPSDAWVAGNGFDSSGQLRILVGHWDGTSWTTSHLTGALREAYNDGSLAAVGPDDVYLVAHLPSGGYIIGHWNGTAWSVLS